VRRNSFREQIASLKFFFRYNGFASLDWPQKTLSDPINGAWLLKMDDEKRDGQIVEANANEKHYFVCEILDSQCPE